jgi:hypothetical protein
MRMSAVSCRLKSVRFLGLGRVRGLGDPLRLCRVTEKLMVICQPIAFADDLSKALRDSNAETSELRQQAAKLSEATLKAFQAVAQKHASESNGK